MDILYILSTLFLEAAARCRGVSQPWSLAFTSPPVMKCIKSRLLAGLLLMEMKEFFVVMNRKNTKTLMISQHISTIILY